jgi:hypothetical protein
LQVGPGRRCRQADVGIAIASHCPYGARPVAFRKRQWRKFASTRIAP